MPEEKKKTLFEQINALLEKERETKEILKCQVEDVTAKLASLEQARKVAEYLQCIEAGEPFEIVPGLVRRKTLEVNRLALWTKEMLQVFGSDDIVTLQEQNNYFDVHEYRQSPDDADPVLFWRVHRVYPHARPGGRADRGRDRGYGTRGA